MSVLCIEIVLKTISNENIFKHIKNISNKSSLVRVVLK